eukprot:CAMPEP_0185835144 /NCGR_PEP_ID=MMETSP1353-20130828/7144_1 /TAXON_ID=1077150 /ORGANISM="Erythrolobus australicus, Strain CCMP3124" /LENGTH=120 /DNA_ID=CAMNT_0028533723 /DNA_START=163 /DNA_END=525 /DNA_ORIENTATION=-
MGGSATIYVRAAVFSTAEETRCGVLGWGAGSRVVKDAAVWRAAAATRETENGPALLDRYVERGLVRAWNASLDVLFERLVELPNSAALLARDAQSAARRIFNSSRTPDDNLNSATQARNP